MGESKTSKSVKTAGKKIGKYQNAVLLAKGGMGAIYKADHPTLNQPVVLKMLTLTGNDQFTQRFQREATIMMGFQHVNIVNYFDHFKTAKSYCMVMELVDGCSVAQLLDKHRYLDDDVALLILRDTLRALVFAHEKGVVHRDIKPANILISKAGEVKLTDFGIAHNQAVDTDGLTKEGMTLGTPSYMARNSFVMPEASTAERMCILPGFFFMNALPDASLLPEHPCRIFLKGLKKANTRDCGKSDLNHHTFPDGLSAGQFVPDLSGAFGPRRECWSLYSGLSAAGMKTPYVGSWPIW